MSDNEEVFLKTGNDAFSCKKSDLIANSDYFKAMFEGNFLEKEQKVIVLKDVDRKALEIILNMITSDGYTIDNEHILLVTQAACMLQFNRIYEECEQKLTEILSPDNCLSVWIMTEPLAIKPLYLKAKCMALIEFTVIKDMDCLLDLNLRQLYFYLSNTKLMCNSEFEVFQTCMNWWYVNSDKKRDDTLKDGPNRTEVFLQFLHCIDLKKITIDNVNEMLTYPDIRDCIEIVDILNNVIMLKEGDTKLLEETERNGNLDAMKTARKLLNCNSREDFSIPCIVVDNRPSYLTPTPEYKLEVYSDKYKRKRRCYVLDGRNASNCSKQIFLYDADGNTFTKLIDIPEEKISKMVGFHILGYKELVFLFGGEVNIGRGTWNLNLWAYDTVRDRWERKCVMPHGRRHFEACIAGDILYIVGGTGNFRIIQDNMFNYNYKTNTWSSLVGLPCSGRQIKCCDYNGQLFIVDMNNMRGYLFDTGKVSWVSLEICGTNNLMSKYPDKFSIFSRDNKIYIKGSVLIELEKQINKLIVTKHVHLEPIFCDSIDSVLCNGVLYMLSKHSMAETRAVRLRKFVATTYASEDIFQHVCDEVTEFYGETCKFTMDAKLFNLKHFRSVETDTYVSDFAF